MKKVRLLYAIVQFVAALLLVGLFVCTMKIGDLLGSGDLSSGIGAAISLLFTFIPFLLYLPVAATLIVFGVLLLLGRGKVALISLIILSIFLPILLFSVVINGALVAGQSALFSAVLYAAAAVYCAAFGLSVAHFCLVRRERRRAAEEA